MAVQINGDTGNVSATKGDFSGNISIGGTLTYEDVTNVDSVGLITARTGIEIGARPGVAASISVDGNMIVSGISTFGGAIKGSSGTFTDAITIVKSSGPLLELTTNTSAADATLRLSEGATGSTSNGGGMFYSGADNKLHITCGTDSTTKRITIARDDGKIGIGTASPATDVHTLSSSDHIITHQSGTSGADVRMNFRDNGSVDQGGIHYAFNGNSMRFRTLQLERLRINSAGNVSIGDQNNAGDALRYFDVYNTNTGTSAGAIMRLIVPRSDGTGTVSGELVKYKTGELSLRNYENQGTSGSTTFYNGANNGSIAVSMTLLATGYHKFNKLPMFISNVTSTLGSAGSLTASPASGKAQLTAAADNNNNFDSTNKNFVCPTNGYYNVVVDFSMGDMALSRRIVVFGYTLGGATGQQSNYVEALDMTMDDHTNQNYSHPWYFTAGTTIAVGMGGLSGDISSQNVQLSVFLITAI